MNLFKLLGKKGNQLKIQRGELGDDWTVKKGRNTLYIGTREKCQTFIEQDHPSN